MRGKMIHDSMTIDYYAFFRHLMTQYLRISSCGHIMLTATVASASSLTKPFFYLISYASRLHTKHICRRLKNTPQRLGSHLPNLSYSERLNLGGMSVNGGF